MTIHPLYLTLLLKMQGVYIPLTNNRINRLHEEWLRVICNDKKSSFVVDFLAKDGSVTIPTRSLQVLATEMLK